MALIEPSHLLLMLVVTAAVLAGAAVGAYFARSGARRRVKARRQLQRVPTEDVDDEFENELRDPKATTQKGLRRLTEQTPPMAPSPLSQSASSPLALSAASFVSLSLPVCPSFPLSLSLLIRLSPSVS
eukprot:6174341-Pleurochrysis_carterae.AAC.3